jgi:hypothetical protein
MKIGHKNYTSRGFSLSVWLLAYLDREYVKMSCLLILD